MTGILSPISWRFKEVPPIAEAMAPLGFTAMKSEIFSEMCGPGNLRKR
jgi:hypothetical protein